MSGKKLNQLCPGHQTLLLCQPHVARTIEQRTKQLLELRQLDLHIEIRSGGFSTNERQPADNEIHHFAQKVASKSVDFDRPLHIARP